MRRVYAVWAMRALMNRVSLKLYALVVFVALSSNYISFKAVVSNFMSVYKTSFSSFIYSAFINTEVITLMLIAGTIAVSLWLMKDIVFSYKHSSAVV